VNTDASWPDLYEAERRVLQIQTKLHRWAGDDPGRRFDDLFNLVADPAFLVVAWDRVRGNRGARSAGVDGVAPRSIVFGSERFLVELRDDLKTRRFVPLPVREKLIPKKRGKLRGLGIPTARDRTVQAALKLVLEPIFEAAFKPCSYGFRPRRRAQDAIEEIFFYATHYYEWVLEGDIKSCFDEIDHTALMGRVRERIGDKRVLGLVKAFLKSGILGEDQVLRDTSTGTPQGGILSPLLANIALSVLDEHFLGVWESWGGQAGRAQRRRRGLANYRLVRYADDCAPRTRGGDDVEGRTRRVVLCQRWRWALRDRPAGGGLKPPQAASVKSRSGERCGNGAPLSASGVSREGERKRTSPMTGRKRIDDIKTGVESLPRDELGGNLLTARVVSGLKVARARFRLWYGTWEPAPRYRPASMTGESENLKQLKLQGAE
jgi:group II intron reverse transcriptase/maturase